MDDIIAARLEIIAAKAKILSTQYSGRAMWPGQLKEGIDAIESEIRQIQASSPDYERDRRG